MNVTNLGIWYQQIPSMVVVNPLGKIVEIREYHGSKFVLRDRKRFVKFKNYKNEYD
jgi:hypothetical protein